MSDKLPIDYARADADVVRKQFRRRVVMFVVATVVVILVGVGWIDSVHKHRFSVMSFGRSRVPPAVRWDGALTLYVTTGLWDSDGEMGSFETIYNNPIVAIEICKYSWLGESGWIAAIRYRTLFLLAMIPWIITLIRLIRVWNVKHVVHYWRSSQDVDRAD